ncbi:MAG: Crp/Fnr family transcriptional regulator [Anaerolinea sp.]|nr:Crp/Fnr family transcriptional regulator [Anaerolinea sp.]
MITQEQLNRIAAVLPVLQGAEQALIRDFQESAYFVRIPSGKAVFTEGDRPNAIALLVSGVVRVYKIGETGRELTLYRFGMGESCILSANAILSDQTFAAIAAVEQEAEAFMIPAEVFRKWVRLYDRWLEFVLDLLSQRLSGMIEIVDEVAFRRMDIRVVSLLLERHQRHTPITITHQEIAAELGSSREVISRILENLTRQGLIRIGRGQIEVSDLHALKSFVLR